MRIKKIALIDFVPISTFQARHLPNYIGGKIIFSFANFTQIIKHD